MRLRQGNKNLGKLAETFGGDEISAQIPIPSVVIKSWLKKLIRPRTQNEQSNLKKDIVANGLTTPIVLATIEGEDNCLVDGHGRLAVYLELNRLTIPYVVKNFKNKDEVKTWVYRKQLGRRNLTKQDRAYLIGSLPSSKAKIAKELEISTTQVADARSYYKAVNWLIENKAEDKEKLLSMPISTTISIYKKLNAMAKCTESVQSKKSVNWKMDESVVTRLKQYASISGNKPVGKVVEDIVREYLDKVESRK